MLKNIYIFVFVLLFTFPCYAQNIQLIDGWYYINGKKFFVKGIGYETHTRPGQVPWIYSFDAELIKFDLERIKNAGYNTIRTWGALSEEELALVEQSGLKILYGIWIDPHGDYGDQKFKNEAYNHVNTVLKYSSKYSSVIGYIIMNEPQVQHIYDAGAQHLSDLWRSIIDLIHEKHPGIPVSFSNTMIGDFINMEIFDFAGYNAYIYNPVTISGSHGYSGFLRYLKQNRAPRMPLIVTEYGLSVSPGTPNDEYGYGANTLEQQTSGDLKMYRGLIDAGAQGGCVFQYHDGWWKGGNEYAHDPVAEEWFGFIEFSGLSDKYGSPRPVWTAYEKYNRAIITNPKNEHIYQNKIPIEFFTTPDVVSFSISHKNNVLLTKPIDGTYYTNEMTLTPDGDVQDFDLDFNFFNEKNDIVKTETISILCTKTNVVLPEINLQVIPADLVPGKLINLKMQVAHNPLFSIDENKIYYVFHPHIGFDPGITKSRTMTFTDNEWSFDSYFNVPPNTKVATFGVGFTIEYGQFKKRISNQKILICGDWANPIAAPELITGIQIVEHVKTNHDMILFQNYPNPFNSSTTIQFYLPGPGPVRMKIYNILGQKIDGINRDYQAGGIKKICWNFASFPSGIYFYELTFGNISEMKKFTICN